MKGFICWDPETVHETIIDDAPRDPPAVFAAVHRPMRILRKTVRTRHEESGTPVSEADVLEDLLREDGQDRMIPITGDSGTGKSHLVRWLSEHIEDDPRRHVVYIEKRGTSLRKVIEKILAGLDDDVPNFDLFQDLQRQVAEAVGSIDRANAPLRLLQEVANAIREHGAEAPADASSDEVDDREDLADHLPDLLTDPEFRKPLLTPNGVIGTSVRQALEGGASRDSGDAPEFTVDDLSFSAVDVTSAARRAQDLKADLYGDDELKRLAVTMMNEALPRAVKSMLGLKAGDLFEILLQVREALHGVGKTLVLLVEDLALLRGVEAELVEAMIATPDDAGERTLCVMRSAVAVTTGYFDSLRTALTRIDARGPLYNLDTVIGDGVTDEDVRAFVAAYLNATRWGRDALQEQFKSADPAARATGRWVRSYCGECPHSEDCHSAFGAENGFGLYPLNAPSLRRIAESQMQAFDPRLILTILSRTLREEASSIQNGDFPSPEWAEPYNAQRVAGAPELNYMPSAVEADIESRDSRDGARRVALLTFWGGAPDGLVNLAEPIHTAFDLPLLDGVPTLVPDQAPPLPAPTPGLRRTKPPVPPPPDRERDDPLTLWSKGQRLEQKLATELRKALRDLVLDARDWAAVGIERSHIESILVAEQFFIKNSGGGGNPSDPIAVFEPSAVNAVLLDAVLTARAQRDWEFPRGSERFIEVAHQVEGWAQTALERMRTQQRGGGDDANPVLAQAMLLSSALVGAVRPGDSVRDLVSASVGELDVPVGGGGWDAVRRKVAEAPSASAARREEVRRRLLDNIALRRSFDAANVVAVDPVPLLQAIDALEQRHWEPPDPALLRPLGRGFSEYLRALATLIEKDLEVRIRTLADERRRALEALGTSVKTNTVAKRFQELDQAARDAGVGARSAAVGRNEVLANLRRADVGMIERLAEFDDPSTLQCDDRLRLASGNEATQILNAAAFVDWATRMLDEVEDAVRQRSTADAAGARVDAAHGELLDVLRAVANDVESG